MSNIHSQNRINYARNKNWSVHKMYTPTKRYDTGIMIPEKEYQPQIETIHPHTQTYIRH